MDFINITTRRARAIIKYNGKNIMTDLKGYATSFNYTDPAAEECDTVSLTISDPIGQWIGAWLPSKGDEIEVAIIFENRNGDKKDHRKECGKFLLDDFSFSEGSSGRTLTIAGISAPLDDAFKASIRTKQWENVTIKQIAETIAGRYNLALYYDASDITLAKKEQSQKTDADFLQQICKTYGLSLKTYSKRIIIFDREKLKKADATWHYDRADCLSFSWKTQLIGSYTGGEINYSSVKSNKTHTYTTGSGKRILKVNEHAASQEDAKLILEAAMANENHNITSCSFSVIGDPVPSASQVILLTGFGQLSGKYYIDKKTENMGSGGYTTSFECSRISESDEEVAQYAIKRLYSLGVINTPEYWLNHLKDIKYLPDLFINADAAIKVTGSGNYTDVNSAIDALGDRGIINSPEYWRSNYKSLANLDQLLIKLANAAEE